MKIIHHPVVFIVLLLAITSIGQAALVLDQAQEDISYGFAYDTATSGYSNWQTFVPTMTTLERVELYLSTWVVGSVERPHGHDVLANISIENNLGASVWSGSYSYSSPDTDLYAWVGVDVPSVALVAGDTYKIVVTGYGVWRGNHESTYPGTSNFAVSTPDTWGDYDYAFRTYSVPEPITLSLLAIGAVALRRRMS